MKKKILLVATGGTFASVKTKDGLRPELGIEELLSFFPEAKNLADIDCLQLCNLDSTNLHPRHWSDMAATIATHYDKYDGFIITHGTDTMQYSASALSFALQGILKPVIFTGSVFSLEEPESDAKANFLDSIRVIASDLIKEVCICFHGNIIKGTRARKVTNEATKITNEKMGVYSSVNLDLMGSIDLGKIIGNKIYFTKNGYPKKSSFHLLSSFDQEVGFLKIHPGIESDILDGYKKKKAVIIEAFGPGNIPFEYSDWLNKIQEMTQEGTLIFVTTQNPFGEVDMEKYEVGQQAMKAGAIPCYDMLPETALVKLMWIFGNYPQYTHKEVEELFLKNIRGEISDKKNRAKSLSGN